MGANMEINQRAKFASEVFSWSGERPADASNVIIFLFR
jgi:hypothetical protein